MEFAKKIEIANTLIEAAKKKFSDAENYGKNILKSVLDAVGEHGVTIANIGDNRGEMRVPTAEVNYADVRPIALIRFWKNNLELFLTDFDENGNVIDEGNWVDYDNAYVDTWYILDKVEENLEYADGYDKD